MKRLLGTLLCLFFLMFCALPVQAASDVPQEVMTAAKSVVRVMSEGASSTATGSGFVILCDSERTLIATNYHVVENKPYNVSLWLGEEDLVDVEILLPVPEKDLCILSVDKNLGIQPLPLAQEPARQGEAVYAVGFPGAADNFSDSAIHASEDATITDGIVSAVRTLTMDDYGDPVSLVQMNAAINSGNSGGPLFNARGQVVGVNTLGVTSAQGVFGAVAVSELQEVLKNNDIVLPAIAAAEELEETESPNAAETLEQLDTAASVLWYLPAVIFAMLGVAALVLALTKKKTNVTLQNLLEANPDGLGVAQAVALLMPVALQLRQLHNDGKLHLQVTAQNILITPKGAQLKAATAQEADRFSAGFAAPEIYQGTGVGMASDVYSLAAVLCYAAIGKAPANSLQREQLEEELTRLDALDAGFAQVIRKAMADAKEERTASVQELIYGVSPFNTQSFQMPSHTADKGDAQGIRKYLLAAGGVLILLAMLATMLPGMAEKRSAYKYAVSLLEADRYDEAITAFAQLDTYKDSAERILETKYEKAGSLLEAEHYDDAIAIFTALGDYSDSAQQLINAENARDYANALALLEAEDYDEAYVAFQNLGDYADSADYFARFQMETVKLSEEGVLDGKKEYTLTLDYKNGRLAKEIFEFTADCESTYYSISTSKSDIPAGSTTAAYTAAYSYYGEGKDHKVNIFDTTKNLYKTYTYTYDESGNLTRKTVDYKSSSSNDATYTYAYDENGNETEYCWYKNLTGSGTPYYRRTKEYDDNNGLVYQYYKYNTYWRYSINHGEYTFENKYDTNGRITEHTAVEGDAYSYKYKYDSKGNLIEEKAFDEDTLKTTYQYEYDDMGNQIKETITYSSERVRVITNTYGEVITFH